MRRFLANTCPQHIQVGMRLYRPKDPDPWRVDSILEHADGKCTIAMSRPTGRTECLVPASVARYYMLAEDFDPD